MDYGMIVAYIQSALVPLITFVVLLVFTMVRGRRAIISLILGLYFALLMSLKFPYYAKLNHSLGGVFSDSTISIVIFALFVLFFSFLMNRLLFYRIDEGAFQSFPKKLLLALMATILVMTYSYHVLPITSIIDPGAPANLLFGPNEYFFWWLMLPLVGLFFL